MDLYDIKKIGRRYDKCACDKCTAIDWFRSDCLAIPDSIKDRLKVLVLCEQCFDDLHPQCYANQAINEGQNKS